MTYDEFIEGINNPDKIKQIDFYIEGYPKKLVKEKNPQLKFDLGI